MTSHGAMTSDEAADAPERSFVVSRPGGDLRVHDLSGPQADESAPLIVLVHGITGNGRAWLTAARALARTPAIARSRIWAPDLRGRAQSRELPGPYGLDAHVADLEAVLDHAGVQRCVLVGHSMGGFITALAGVTIPDRLLGEVLVDGGPAFPAPEDLDVDAALQAVIGPAMTRLTMRFADSQAYLQFWQQHPAVGPALNSPAGADVAAYLLADLVPAQDGSGEWISSCILEAIRADGRGVLTAATTHAAPRQAAEAGMPIEFIWAERGLMNESLGLYDDDRVAALDLPEEIHVTAVGDVNHYSILFEPAGIAAIGAGIERVLAAPAR